MHGASRWHQFHTPINFRMQEQPQSECSVVPDIWLIHPKTHPPSIISQVPCVWLFSPVSQFLESLGCQTEGLVWSVHHQRSSAARRTASSTISAFNYNQFSYILGHTDNVYIPGTQTDWLNMHVLYLPFWRHTTTRICCYRIVSNNGIIYMAKQNNVG